MKIIETLINEYIQKDTYDILRISSETFGICDFLIDKDMTEKCKQHNWCIHLAGRQQHKKYYYALKQDNSNKELLHRFVMNCPDNMVVDHISGNTLDNRRINLRIISHQQNCINRQMNHNNTSGVKGVTWNKREEKWMAYIHINNKFKNLGYFDNIKDAANVRKIAENKRLENMNMN